MAVLALHLVEVTVLQMLPHVLPKDSLFSDLQVVAAILLDAVEWALVVLVETLRQVLEGLLVRHILPSTLLMMLAVQFETVQVSLSKRIQLTDTVSASIFFADWTHLFYLVVLLEVGAIQTEDIGALPALLRLTGQILAALAHKVLNVLLKQLQIPFLIILKA